MSKVLPRRFALVRRIDYTGVSGVGVVAYGVAFADGHIALRWCSNHPATSMWASIDDLLAVHGHGDTTTVEWIDAPPGDIEDVAPRSGSGRRARRRAARAAEQAEPPVGVVRETEPAPPHRADVEPRPRATPGAGAEPQPRTTPGAGTEPPTRADEDEIRRRADPANERRTRSEEDEDRRPGEEAVVEPSRSRGLLSLIDFDREPRTERESRVEREPRTDGESGGDREARNGHLDIDTAPLLYDATPARARPLAEPARSASGQRRGGRHRRPEPPDTGR